MIHAPRSQNISELQVPYREIDRLTRLTRSHMGHGWRASKAGEKGKGATELQKQLITSAGGAVHRGKLHFHSSAEASIPLSCSTGSSASPDEVSSVIRLNNNNPWPCAYESSRFVCHDLPCSMLDLLPSPFECKL